MNINQIPDKVLADMVRQGCYSRNTDFTNNTRLLVLAVPYSRDEAETLQDAFESFRELLTGDDWEERNIQVLEVENDIPQVYETAIENLALEQ